MESLNGETTQTTLDLSLDQVHTRILELVEAGHGTAYQIGRLYNYVVDSELAQKGGFKDAQAFFREKVKVLGQTILSRNGTVARTFPESIARKYGISNLYTLIAYAKEAHLTLDTQEPGPTPVDLPQKDGTLKVKPFADCSVAELQRAVNHKKPADKSASLPAPHEASVQRYRDNLLRHFPEQHGIKVDARRSPVGELLISLRDIPESQMQRLVAALMDAPASAPQPVAAPSVALDSGSGATPAVPVAPPVPSNTALPDVLRATGQGAANDSRVVPTGPVTQTQPTDTRDMTGPAASPAGPKGALDSAAAGLGRLLRRTVQRAAGA